MLHVPGASPTMRTRCPGEGRPTLLQGAPPPRGRGGAAAARGSHSEKGGTGRGLPNSLLHGSGDGEADNQLEPTASLVSVRLGAGDEAAPGSGGLHGNLAGNASGLISPPAPRPSARSQPARLGLTTPDSGMPAGHGPERRLSSGPSRCVPGHVRLWGEGRNQPGHIGTVLPKREA